jgi:hypothetical protein
MADAFAACNANEIKNSDTPQTTFSLQLISHIPAVTKSFSLLAVVVISGIEVLPRVMVDERGPHWHLVNQCAKVPKACRGIECGARRTTTGCRWRSGRGHANHKGGGAANGRIE